jgi:hypothetical protein
MSEHDPRRWRVGLARIDWANPASGYDFPTEAAANRFAAAHARPGRNVVVFAPGELDVQMPTAGWPVSVAGHRRRRKPPVARVSDETLALFEAVTS